MEQVAVESANGTDDVTPTARKKKGPKNQERFSLSEVALSKLDGWCAVARDASRGFLSLSRSDLMSFLIGEHRDELSPSEVKRLRALHYDPIRHIQWITPQIKDALTQGDASRVAELQGELRGVELSILPPSGVGAAAVLVTTGASLPRKSKNKPKKSDQSKSLINSEKADSIE
ncbi:MAG: hypothetical protein P4M08_13925 [Oligoflexia bacterium]|nr:hypothetical protein [Oligoflexia bacterium]